MTPRVQVEAIGARQSVVLTAVMDTGFGGDLCLPSHIAVSLGLELTARGWVEYADRRRERELTFSGEARFQGKVLPVEISLTEGDQALAGMGLLAGHTLIVDGDTGAVRIEPKAKAGDH